jgi:hypothetical protein
MAIDRPVARPPCLLCAAATAILAVTFGAAVSSPAGAEQCAIYLRRLGTQTAIPGNPPSYGITAAMTPLQLDSCDASSSDYAKRGNELKLEDSQLRRLLPSIAIERRRFRNCHCRPKQFPEVRSIPEWQILRGAMPHISTLRTFLACRNLREGGSSMRSDVVVCRVYAAAASLIVSLACRSYMFARRLHHHGCPYIRLFSVSVYHGLTTTNQPGDAGHTTRLPVERIRDHQPVPEREGGTTALL